MLGDSLGRSIKAGLVRHRKALAVAFAGLALLFAFQNCAPTTFDYQEESSKKDATTADVDSFHINQPGVCSSDNSLEFELTFVKGQTYFCNDSTKLAEPLGQICALGPTIIDFSSPVEPMPCESLSLCGMEPSKIEITAENEKQQTIRYHFSNLPLGCAGSIKASHQAQPNEEQLPEQEFAIRIAGGSCQTCEYNGITSCGECLNTAENCTAPGKIFLEGKCIDEPNLSNDVDITAKSIYDEGEVAFFNVLAENVSEGTELSFKVTGTGINKDSRDFANNGTGTFKFEQGKGRFSLSILADFVSEGDEIAQVIVFNKDETILTKSITLKDTSRSPSTQLNGPTQINEGETASFSISTIGLPNGTTLYYRLEGTALNQGSMDFKNSSRGTLLLNNNAATLALAAQKDLFTEGEELINVIIYNSGGVLAQKVLSINDTSLSPTAELRSADIMLEGETLTLQLNVEGVPVGTLLNYAVLGAGINQGSADFENSGKGSISFQVNPVVIALTAIEDLKTEGDETLAFKVSFAGRALTEKNIILKDSSKATVVNLASASVANEGDLLTVLAQAPLPDGTILTYKVSGAGINTGTPDFSGNGTGEIVFQQGQAQIPLEIIADERTEGTETFTLSVNSFGGRLAERSISINDTSQVRPGAIEGPTTLTEGQFFDYLFTAPGAMDGTSITYKVTALGSASSTGDFKSMSGVVKVYGEMGGFSLESLADLRTEGTENFNLSISSPMGLIAEVRLVMTDNSLFPKGNLTGSYDVNEGSTYEYIFSSNDIPEGTKVTYRVTGSGINSGGQDVVGGGNGSFLMTGTQSTVQMQYIPDLKSEGIEYMTLSFSISTGTVVERIIKIRDTSVVPFASLTASRSFEEGTSVELTYTATTLENGTLLKFKVSGTGINTNGLDFTNSGAGTLTINDGSALITLQVLADLKTEGTETFNFIVYNDYGTLYSKAFTISDTSRGSSLSFDSSPTVATEGTELTLNLTLTGTPDGAILPYSLSGPLITPQDFNPAQTSGNLTAVNGTGQIVIRLVNDGIAEGDESLVVTVTYAGQTITKNITVRDP